MPSLRDVFSAPFNWCDRRCERCPLEDTCPLARRERQLQWVHEARGEDPDDPAVIMVDASQMLGFTLRLVLEIAEEEGIDLNAPLPKRPAVLAAKRLEQAGMTLVRNASELWKAAEAAGCDCAELRFSATKLAAKAARIASYLEDPEDEDIWVADAAPNLLLIDRVKRQFADELARVSPDAGSGVVERVTRALAELERILDPLIRDFGDGARAMLAALEARGSAPSPFVCKSDGTTAAPVRQLRIVRNKDS
jgi:hypothetical protein